MNNLNFSAFAKTVVLVAVWSVVVNVALDYLGKLISNPIGFGPYMYDRVALYTLGGVIGAAVVYAGMRWWIPDRTKANRYYIILSIVLLVLSFIPDLMLPYSTDADDMGWTVVSIINLMIMHTATAGIVLYYFTRRTE